MSRYGRPSILNVITGVLGVVAVILLIGIFSGRDAPIYEDTPDVPPAAHR